MNILTPQQIQRIYEVTDSFLLDRNTIVVTLSARDAGLETVLPDGKLLVRAPSGDAFEPWFSGLRRRLAEMDLSRTPRRRDPAPR